jgi:hypothetical protein
MPIGIRVTGHEQLRQTLNRAPALYEEAFRVASEKAEIALKRIILETFEVAISTAGEGFPPVYGAQLLEVVRQTDVRIYGSASYFSVEYDFEELGSYEDLSEGFHYQAMLADGDRVELPYQGQALKNDLVTRYAFWLTISETWGGRIPGGAHLNDTYAARVALWSSKGVAPQWLLLNYGQSEFAPFIQPFPIVETVQAEIYQQFYAILAREVERVTYTINSSEAAFKSRPTVRPVRGPGGRFIGSERL